jgi:outer membrane protein assembly factor BamB
MDTPKVTLPSRLRSVSGLIFVLWVLALCPSGWSAEPGGASPAAAKRRPFDKTYGDYLPGFLTHMREAMAKRGGRSELRHLYVSSKVMKLSSEKGFYTLSLINESSRVTALIKAAHEREEKGLYREALAIYQTVIDQFPDELHRVSKYGVFVPASLYCQLCILAMPKRHLDFYRTKYDPRARDAFEQGARRNALAILAHIRDTALATSYGGRSLQALGDAALDNGHFLEAIEYYDLVRTYFPDAELQTATGALKLAYAHRRRGEKPPATGSPAPKPGSEEVVARLRRLVSEAKPDLPPYHQQLASEPCVGTDDYTPLPPSNDPMALRPPVWRITLPGSNGGYLRYRGAILPQACFSDPVVTGRSVIFRFKNVVYCHSIVNGELRWKNDLGGRRGWQDYGQRQFNHEQVLVQDGLVFTSIYRGGPSLVALDETTGRLRWVYGPMAATTLKEAQTRFESVPAGGPSSVFAGYIRNDIQGDTHIITEYGLVGLESGTGRVLWKRDLSSLPPGRFTSGFAVRYRNRIRSFSSPPLYHQGTVYYSTNAGVVSAVDALSGQVKWLFRYPYYPSVHDATRPYGYAAPWFPQRPILFGDRLIVTPIDTGLMLCIDRRTGKVLWSRSKGTLRDRVGRLDDGALGYVVGATTAGQLVLVFSDRHCPAQLVDIKTGKTLWNCPALLNNATEPFLKYGTGNLNPWRPTSIGYNGWPFFVRSRPFLTTDDTLYLMQFGSGNGSHIRRFTTSYLAGVDLRTRKEIGERRFISHLTVDAARRAKEEYAHNVLREYEKVPENRRPPRVKQEIPQLKEIIAAPVPANKQPGFEPFSRLTFRRHGVLFELRFGIRTASMLYDRAALEKAVGGETSEDALLIRAELAVGVTQLERAAELVKKGLAACSADDLDYRAMANQQLYAIHKRLARSAVQAGDAKEELAQCLGMTRTVGTLADEIESRFAIAEAYARQGNTIAAARTLRSIIDTFGHYEYPTPSIFSSDTDYLAALARQVIDRTDRYADGVMYEEAISNAAALLKASLPVYFSALTPLDKDLNVRAGDLAVDTLRRLQESSKPFAQAFEKEASAAFRDQPLAVQRRLIWQYPRTQAAQQAVNRLFEADRRLLDAPEIGQDRRAELRKSLWSLADVARVCGLDLPKDAAERLLAPRDVPPEPPLRLPAKTVKQDLGEDRDTMWKLLERRGQRHVQPRRFFLGGRVKKRLDSKFVLWCLDSASGEVLWKATDPAVSGLSDELRLKGTGQEPGFVQAFVLGDLVVTHGLYDVLAFGLADGRLRWRYRVPFDFEIETALLTGDLLVLSGASSTIALYVPTRDPRGELAWQASEEGDLYVAPYLVGDRLVSVRQMPFNVTTRYRSTGKLIGRLELPPLLRNRAHPLIEKGLSAYPVAHHGTLLAVTNGSYYLLVDVKQLRVLWKRLIDNNNPYETPALRFALNDQYLAVVKDDFDVDAIYMLSSQTGQVLWRTDPKDAGSVQPVYQMQLEGDRLYGLAPHPGQGFYFDCVDAKTGKRIYRTEVAGYDAQPQVTLMDRAFGPYRVARTRDRQDFDLRVFDCRNGKNVARVEVKGAGDYGEYGRVSANGQNGALALYGMRVLKLWSAPGK